MIMRWIIEEASRNHFYAMSRVGSRMVKLVGAKNGG
jgi:hypothetical protein